MKRNTSSLVSFLMAHVGAALCIKCDDYRLCNPLTALRWLTNEVER